MNSIIRIIIFALLLITSCNSREATQDKILSKHGIENSKDFAALSPCRQIEIYAFLGSEYTDVEHMTVIVPQWVQDEIDSHPAEIVVDCIVDEADNLLSHWGESNNKNRKISYSIHALLYKANELDITKYPKVEELFNRVVCRDKVFYDGQLILIYYTSKFGIANFPSHESMISVLCK